MRIISKPPYCSRPIFVSNHFCFSFTQGSLALSDRALAMDAFGQAMVVATADKKVHTVNLQNPGAVANVREICTFYRICTVGV